MRKKSIKFLGHVVTADGVQPDPAKLDTMESIPAPTNDAELRCTLGLFASLSKFVSDMSQPHHVLC